MRHIGKLGFDPFNTYWIVRDDDGEWFQLGLGFYWRESKTHPYMKTNEKTSTDSK